VLEAGLRAVPAWGGRDLEITPIDAGITNRNFRVDVGDEAFVLRLSGRDTDLLGIDRHAEVQAARAAAAAGVGPDVVAFLPDHETLVTRFVPGSPISEDDLQRPEVLALVASSVRTIHGLEPIPSSFPVFRIVEDYRRVADDRGVPAPAAYHDALAVASIIEDALAVDPTPAVTCHNDLLNANFLRDGDHVWIVDYEYAGMGDRFFDLGNLAVNNSLSDAAQESLLLTYLHDVSDRDRAHLALMRIMSDFREAMWGVVQQAISTLDVDYVDYANRHLDRLMRSASDERFRDWIEAAKGG